MLIVLILIPVLPAGALAQSLPANASGTGKSSAHVCTSAAAGRARCHALIRTDTQAKNARPRAGKNPPSTGPDVLGNSGAYGPSYLQSAYQTPSASGGSGQTVAIIDAFDDPSAEADLATYRSNFGLPPCTSASGCFRKVNQNGQSSPLPRQDSGWSQEISLDIDMVSAICPNCRILLLEANDNSTNNLAAAVNTAASMGATAISNSYGSSEYSGQTSMDAAFNHPGITITASAGDNGYGVQWPASSPYVTAVGGTTLSQLTDTGTRNAVEVAWSGTGSGCSMYESKPSWQKDAGCARRAVADVSAEADPNTGVWVYNNGGWGVFGGTSAAAPIVAAVAALAGNGGAANPSSFPYGTPAALNDISSGSNGGCGTYLCNAAPGYDGPTGLGTPNGVAAFKPPSVAGGGGGGGGGGGSACYTATAPTQPGANLTISTTSSNQVKLTWTRQGSEAGYCIMRLSPTKTDVFTGPNASQTLSWMDTSPPSTACYVVLSVSSGTVIGTSDTLCALPNTHAGSAVPSNFRFGLGKSTTASLSWTPAAGATGQILYTIPVDGSTPRPQTLSASASSASNAADAAGDCYLVMATLGTTTLGNSDVLCGIPGSASGAAPAATHTQPGSQLPSKIAATVSPNIAKKS